MLIFESLFKRFSIPFAVFITGACVLVIEVVAVRILSPYFGNSIFTISSVLSVVLLALSLGYYAGGKLADRFPKESLFYGIILLSGICVIVLHVAGIIFLSSFGYTLSVINGPLISSAALFFAQSFLLGLLSPFAIKLQTMRSQTTGVGSVSGEIFFFSTLGSIAGSLSAGFFLIPNFGVDKIIVSTGLILIILGLTGNLQKAAWFKLSLIVCIFISSQPLLGTLSLAAQQGTLIYKDSMYQKITIYEGIYGNASVRFLLQDRNSSAAQFTAPEHINELVYEYTKYYELYKIANPNIKNALVIGGGAYSIPKALLQDSATVNVDVAEIDPMIFALAKEYFNIPDDPRLQNFAQDGRRFLYNSSKKYDMIFSDAYASLYSTPEHLTTMEFFTLAKEKLSDNGVFIANVVGSLAQKPQSFLLSEIKTFKNVFENSYFFAVTSAESQKIQNIIFVGYNNNDKLDLAGTDMKKHENYIIRMLPEKFINTDSFDFSPYPLLTDNYAPVDYLISQEFRDLQ